MDVKEIATKPVCPQCGEQLVKIDGYRWCRNCDPPEVLYGTDFVEKYEKEITELEAEKHYGISIENIIKTGGEDDLGER